MRFLVLGWKVLKIHKHKCEKYTNANGKGSKYTNAIEISIIYLVVAVLVTLVVSLLDLLIELVV